MSRIERGFVMDMRRIFMTFDDPLIRISLFVMAAGIFSIFKGQDSNWDLNNYHYYDVWAFLNGRVAVDLMAADLQTYFNPLIDIPYYEVTKHFGGFPRFCAWLMGAPGGLFYEATYRLALCLLRRPSRSNAWVATFLVATSANALSGLGSTHDDILVGAIFLWGVVLLLDGLQQRVRVKSTSVLKLALAGLLCGGAVGLKLTHFYLVFGLLIFIVFYVKSVKEFLIICLYFGAGGVVGAVVVTLPEGLDVYRRFGNPLFPMMNDIFHSPWFPPVAERDTQKLPQSFFQAIFFPFYWLKFTDLVSDNGFQDNRWALGYLSFWFNIGALGWIAVRQRLAGEHWGRREWMCLLVVQSYLIVSYVIWEVSFSYLRYLTALEPFLAIVTIEAIINARQLVVARWQKWHPTSDGGWRANPDRIVSAVIVAMFGVLSLNEVPPYFHHSPFGQQVFEFQSPKLPPHALVLTGMQPVAIALPFMAEPDTRFVGVGMIARLAKGYHLFDETTRIITSHHGPLYYLSHDVGEDTEAAEEEYGFHVKRETCSELKNNFTPPGEMVFCEAELNVSVR